MHVTVVSQTNLMHFFSQASLWRYHQTITEQKYMVCRDLCYNQLLIHHGKLLCDMISWSILVHFLNLPSHLFDHMIFLPIKNYGRIFELILLYTYCVTRLAIAGHLWAMKKQPLVCEWRLQAPFRHEVAFKERWSSYREVSYTGYMVLIVAPGCPYHKFQ